MSITYTMLRYPGGKSRLFPYVSALMRNNALIDGHYVEPYAGGAGLAMSLLLKGYARYLHLNDLDPAIYAFWWGITEKNADFIKLIEQTPITITEWKKQKAIQQEPEKHDTLTLGFSTFFLNRTNHSGILKAGVIGGKEQAGKYKLDARFNKYNLIKKARLIDLYKSRITITQENAADFLTNHASNLPSNTLINLDPPYYIKGKQLYQNWYQHQDHADIAEIIPTLKPYWIITYDDVQAIHKLYHNHNIMQYRLGYSAANKPKTGQEVLITDDRLILPDYDLLMAA